MSDKLVVSCPDISGQIVQHKIWHKLGQKDKKRLFGTVLALNKK
jgi:hypothetical protein